MLTIWIQVSRWQKLMTIIVYKFLKMVSDRKAVNWKRLAQTRNEIEETIIIIHTVTNRKWRYGPNTQSRTALRFANLGHQIGKYIRAITAKTFIEAGKKEAALRRWESDWCHVRSDDVFTLLFYFIFFLSKISGDIVEASQ